MKAVAIPAVFSCLVALCLADDPTIILGVCPGREKPLATPGNSCGVPPFVNVTEFGDNMDTIGKMRVVPTADGLDLRIAVDNLPKPNLVLTAWLIWVPFGAVEPPVFEVSATKRWPAQSVIACLNTLT